MKQQHTKGPWVIDEFYENGGFYKIRSASENICHTHAFAPSGTTPEAAANAALIAAAPDLYEALKAWLSADEIVQEKGPGVESAAAWVAAIQLRDAALQKVEAQ